MNVDYMKKTLKLLLLILSCGALYLCKIKMHDNINIKGRVHVFQGPVIMWNYQFVLNTNNSRMNIVIISRNKECITNKLIGMMKTIFKPKVIKEKKRSIKQVQQILT